MSDKYIDFVSGGFGKTLADRLGLPKPVTLRRHAGPGTPLVTGPVLVVSDESSRTDADAVARAMLPWGLDVRRDTHLAEDARWGAVVVVLTGITHPRDLAAPVLELGSTLRRLGRSGRVVTISRPAVGGPPAPEVTAARNGVDGFLRSLAKELRSGATGNGIVLADGVGVVTPSALGTLRFLLSARSAFVDGQPLLVTGPGAEDPSWDHPLQGRVAVVTGAARGIGAEIARILHRDGATVVGVDVPAAGDSLAAVMNGVRGTALQLDITAPDAAERIHAHAVARHGGLDIVVHNAGILRDKLLANMTPDRWNDLIAVNIAAPLAMNRTFVELGRAGGLGPAPRLVALASTSGIAGNRGQTNYGAAKAGIIGMTRALAPTLAELGGTANAVAPGFIETEMTSRIPPVTREVARRLNSLQQGGLPVDVAEAIAFLCSPAAGGVNGQVLRVCGQSMVGQ